jgi:sarcosine oxidase subunit beta
MSAVLHADVLIIGGGLVGAATAFHLRAQHAMSVVLLERDRVGSQASGVNFGNVRRQGRFLPQLPLAHRARAIWGQLGPLLGDDCEFIATGHVKVAYDDAELGELEHWAAEARHWDLHIEMLGANTLRARYPWLGRDAVGAGHSPEDGHANPRLVAPAFARAARRLGATILEHTAATSLERDGAGFRVLGERGVEVRARVLVNAAGAWGGRIAQQFAEPVPIEARGPQMSVTEPLPYFIAPVLGTASAKIYARQVTRGNVVFGGGERVAVQMEPPRARVLPERMHAQWPELLRLVPGLRGAQVLRTWSGVEGYLSDMLPVLGPSAGVPGLLHGFGFSGHGFQLGPGVGAVLAELAATGATSTPIDAFGIERFLADPGAAQHLPASQDAVARHPDASPQQSLPAHG